jgi:hypothetical protein
VPRFAAFELVPEVIVDWTDGEGNTLSKEADEEEVKAAA